MSSKNIQGTWEDLRKYARSLETDIDSKLVELSKFGHRIGNGADTTESHGLLQADNAAAEFEDRVLDIESKLEELSGVNESMSNLSTSDKSGPGLYHTLQRHREILIDYRKEFSKTRGHVSGILDREDLLNSVHRELNRYKKNKSGEKKEMDILVMENESARNTERLVDEQITLAMESRDSLVKHRQLFKSMQTKMNDLAHRFPMMNNLIQKINLKKKKDSVILGIVIGGCLLFIMWYYFA